MIVFPLNLTIFLYYLNFRLYLVGEDHILNKKKYILLVLETITGQLDKYVKAG